MITTYEFPNQWNWRIFLAVADEGEEVNDILDHLNNKENCYFNLDNNEITNPPCFVSDSKSLIGVICIDKFSFTSKDIMVCVHELIHLMISISTVNGCAIDISTTECWAYFFGNITFMMLEILKSHFEEIKTEKQKKKGIKNG